MRRITPLMTFRAMSASELLFRWLALRGERFIYDRPPEPRPGDPEQADRRSFPPRVKAVAPAAWPARYPFRRADRLRWR